MDKLDEMLYNASEYSENDECEGMQSRINLLFQEWTYFVTVNQARRMSLRESKRSLPALARAYQNALEQVDCSIANKSLQILLYKVIYQCSTCQKQYFLQQHILGCMMTFAQQIIDALPEEDVAQMTEETIIMLHEFLMYDANADKKIPIASSEHIIQAGILEFTLQAMEKHTGQFSLVKAGIELVTYTVDQYSACLTNPLNVAHKLPISSLKDITFYHGGLTIGLDAIENFLYAGSLEFAISSLMLVNIAMCKVQELKDDEAFVSVVRHVCVMMERASLQYPNIPPIIENVLSILQSVTFDVRGIGEIIALPENSLVRLMSTIECSDTALKLGIDLISALLNYHLTEEFIPTKHAEYILHGVRAIKQATIVSPNTDKIVCQKADQIIKFAETLMMMENSKTDLEIDTKIIEHHENFADHCIEDDKHVEIPIRETIDLKDTVSSTIESSAMTSSPFGSEKAIKNSKLDAFKSELAQSIRTGTKNINEDVESTRNISRKVNTQSVENTNSALQDTLGLKSENATQEKFQQMLEANNLLKAALKTNEAQVNSLELQLQTVASEKAEIASQFQIARRLAANTNAQLVESEEKFKSKIFVLDSKIKDRNMKIACLETEIASVKTQTPTQVYDRDAQNAIVDESLYMRTAENCALLSTTNLDDTKNSLNARKEMMAPVVSKDDAELTAVAPANTQALYSSADLITSLSDIHASISTPTLTSSALTPNLLTDKLQAIQAILVSTDDDQVKLSALKSIIFLNSCEISLEQNGSQTISSKNDTQIASSDSTRNNKYEASEALELKAALDQKKIENDNLHRTILELTNDVAAADAKLENTVSHKNHEIHILSMKLKDLRSTSSFEREKLTEHLANMKTKNATWECRILKYEQEKDQLTIQHKAMKEEKLSLATRFESLELENRKHKDAVACIDKDLVYKTTLLKKAVQNLEYMLQAQKIHELGIPSERVELPCMQTFENQIERLNSCISTLKQKHEKTMVSSQYNICLSTNANILQNYEDWLCSLSVENTLLNTISRVLENTQTEEILACRSTMSNMQQQFNAHTETADVEIRELKAYALSFENSISIKNVLSKRCAELEKQVKAALDENVELHKINTDQPKNLQSTATNTNAILDELTIKRSNIDSYLPLAEAIPLHSSVEALDSIKNIATPKQESSHMFIEDMISQMFRAKASHFKISSKLDERELIVQTMKGVKVKLLNEIDILNDELESRQIQLRYRDKNITYLQEQLLALQNERKMSLEDTRHYSLASMEQVENLDTIANQKLKNPELSLNLKQSSDQSSILENGIHGSDQSKSRELLDVVQLVLKINSSDFEILPTNDGELLSLLQNEVGTLNDRFTKQKDQIKQLENTEYQYRKAKREMNKKWQIEIVRSKSLEDDLEFTKNEKKAMEMQYTQKEIDKQIEFENLRSSYDTVCKNLSSVERKLHEERTSKLKSEADAAALKKQVLAGQDKQKALKNREHIQVVDATTSNSNLILNRVSVPHEICKPKHLEPDPHFLNNTSKNLVRSSSIAVQIQIESDELVCAVRELDIANRKVDKYQKMLHALENELTDTRNKLDVVIAENMDKQSRIDAFVAKLNEHSILLENAIAFKITIKELEQKNDNLKSELANFHERMRNSSTSVLCDRKVQAGIRKIQDELYEETPPLAVESNSPTLHIQGTMAVRILNFHATKFILFFSRERYTSMHPFHTANAVNSIYQK